MSGSAVGLLPGMLIVLNAVETVAGNRLSGIALELPFASSQSACNTLLRIGPATPRAWLRPRPG